MRAEHLQLLKRVASTLLLLIAGIFGGFVILAALGAFFFVLIGYMVEEDMWYAFEHYAGALLFVLVGAVCALVAAWAQLARHLLSDGRQECAVDREASGALPSPETKNQEGE